ncbi:hypothetical protein HPB50_014844 [Hyalomma asiaticum]|uniref:Uncharacterized protein n=1 Tax=Hyalomma asiaticum TaxID=266040 RepID=A0ACB7T1Y6_HYAAI|nr:hypothetical protein HPB50_014844 [Hyalomma asiaticum]
MQAQEDVSKHLVMMKNMLYGTCDTEPQTDIVVAQLAQELYNTNLLLLLVQNLSKIDFEGKKDVAQIFNNILRRQIGTRSPTVDYICTKPDILFTLIQGDVGEARESDSARARSLRQASLHLVRGGVGQEIALSGDIVQQKALDFAFMLGIDDSKASIVWLNRFKFCHSIIGKILCGQAALVDNYGAAAWMGNLQVKYVAHSWVWMTRAIFRKRVQEFVRDMGGQGRKVCLHLDNCSVHAIEDAELEIVQVKFLPVNCTAIIRPVSTLFKG